MNRTKVKVLFRKILIVLKTIVYLARSTVRSVFYELFLFMIARDTILVKIIDLIELSGDFRG